MRAPRECVDDAEKPAAIGSDAAAEALHRGAVGHALHVHYVRCSNPIRLKADTTCAARVRSA